MAKFGNLDIYNGSFSDGKINGKSNKGKILTSSISERFQFEGQGVMKYRQGHVYSGQWRDWYRFGEGVLTLRNGDVFTGNFDDLYGKGIMNITRS